MSGRAPWQVIETVYAVWGEWGRIDEYPTLDEALRIASTIKDMSHKRGTRYISSWLGLRDYVTQGLDIQTYLTDRKAWSPYLDQVAIDRFVRTLEWDDYLDLTTRERTEAEYTLARRVDPLDWEGSSVGSRYDMNGLNAPDTPPRDATWRGRRFRASWPKEEREDLRDRISRKRQLLKKKRVKARAVA